jgi:hypothetical protein
MAKPYIHGRSIFLGEKIYMWWPTERILSIYARGKGDLDLYLATAPEIHQFIIHIFQAIQIEDNINGKA